MPTKTRHPSRKKPPRRDRSVTARGTKKRICKTGLTKPPAIERPAKPPTATGPAANVFKRSPRAKNRLIRNGLAVLNAAEALGPIVRGCEIYCLTTGQFSLIDVVQHILAATGPARLIVSTWTAAGCDVDIAYKLLGDGAVTSLRFIVDVSFPVRQPAYCAALRERFGDEAIRVTKNHAKFVLIRNDAWSVVVRTSMNLNENRRMENLEISDDRPMAEFLEGVCERIFAAEPAGQSFTNKPGENCQQFDKTFGIARREGEKSADEKKFFGDGPFENDIRRAGQSWD